MFLVNEFYLVESNEFVFTYNNNIDKDINYLEDILNFDNDDLNLKSY